MEINTYLSHLKQQLELVKNKEKQLAKIKWQNIIELKCEKLIKTTPSLEFSFNVESKHFKLFLNFNWFHFTSSFGEIVSGGPNSQLGS